MLDQGVVTLGDPGRPGAGIAKFRCAGRASRVAGGASGAVHRFSRLQLLRRIDVFQRETFIGDRMDACGDRFVRLRFGAGPDFFATGDVLCQ